MIRRSATNSELQFAIGFAAIVCIISWLAIPAGVARADALQDALDVNQPYSAERSNPVTYDVEFVVTVTAPYQTKVLRVWLPIPPTDHAQQLLESNLSTFPNPVAPSLNTEPEYGNRFAYFEFANPTSKQRD